MPSSVSDEALENKRCAVASRSITLKSEYPIETERLFERSTSYSQDKRVRNKSLNSNLDGRIVSRRLPSRHIAKAFGDPSEVSEIQRLSNLTFQTPVQLHTNLEHGSEVSPVVKERCRIARDQPMLVHFAQSPAHNVSRLQSGWVFTCSYPQPSVSLPNCKEMLRARQYGLRA